MRSTIGPAPHGVERLTIIPFYRGRGRLRRPRPPVNRYYSEPLYTVRGWADGTPHGELGYRAGRAWAISQDRGATRWAADGHGTYVRYVGND